MDVCNLAQGIRIADTSLVFEVPSATPRARGSNRAGTSCVNCNDDKTASSTLHLRFQGIYHLFFWRSAEKCQAGCFPMAMPRTTTKTRALRESCAGSSWLDHHIRCRKAWCLVLGRAELDHDLQVEHWKPTCMI